MGPTTLWQQRLLVQVPHSPYWTGVRFRLVKILELQALCRTNPSQWLSTPGNGTESWAGPAASRKMPRMTSDGGDIERFLSDLDAGRRA